MILAVTLNAAVDKTLVVRDFRLNGRHYADKVVAVPGGKGINVARVLTELGAPVKVLGFAAGHGGRFIEDGLAQEGIPSELVPVPGESRMCLTVVDEAGHSHTEVNEQGPVVQAQSIEEFLAVYRRNLETATAVVLSGSIPPGVPETIYRDCLDLAAGRPTVLDAKAGALRYGLEAHPLMVKPNREELSELVADDIRSVDAAVASLPRVHAMGARTVLVSLGEEGAILSTPQGRLHGTLRNGKVVSAVGSGDSLVAAWLWSTLQQGSAELS